MRVESTRGIEISVCLVCVCVRAVMLQRAIANDDEFCILMCRKDQSTTTFSTPTILHGRPMWVHSWLLSSVGDVLLHNTWIWVASIWRQSRHSEGFAFYLFSLSKWNARPWNQFMKIFGPDEREDISSIHINNNGNEAHWMDARYTHIHKHKHIHDEQNY